MERLLLRVRKRVLKLLEKRGKLEAEGPENGQEAYQAASLQQRMPWAELEVKQPSRKKPRCAFIEGFSLHAKMCVS